MAKKDAMQAVLRGQPCKGFMHPEGFHMVFTPGERNMRGELQPDGSVIGKDWFDVIWVVPKGMARLNGPTVAQNGCPCDDIADAVKFVPTPEQVRAFDWKSWAESELKNFDPEEQVLQCRSGCGFFERMHCLMGFEDALCAFYEDPEGVKTLFQAILEYKMAVVDCVCQVCSPEILIFDDDYGTAHSTFIDPVMWREFFPQYWRPLVEHVHSKGVKFELHSCGYITPLVGDFVALGVDILQPLQTNNDLKTIKEQYGDKLILRLAIFDKQMAMLNQTEEQVRADLRNWYSILAPGGRFLPEIVGIDDPYYVIQRQIHKEFEADFFGQDT